jgi:hypothetical protein
MIKSTVIEKVVGVLNYIYSFIMCESEARSEMRRRENIYRRQQLRRKHRIQAVENLWEEKTVRTHLLVRRSSWL